MGGLITQTQAMVYSWHEVEEMCEALVGSMYSNDLEIKAIWYADLDSMIPAYLMSKMAMCPFSPNGLVFGLTDIGKNVDVCFHHIEFPSEHFTYIPKIYLYNIDANEEGHYPRTQYPWNK